MKLILLVVLAVVLSGCESLSKETDIAVEKAPAASAPAEEFSVLNDVKNPFPHTGRFAAVIPHWQKDNYRLCLDYSTYKQIEEATQKFLTDRGFKVISSTRKAHLLVVIYCDQFESDAEVETIHEERKHGVVVSRKADKKKAIARRVSLAFQSQRYGERPPNDGAVAVASYDMVWSSSLPRIKDRLLVELAKVPIQAPKEDTKMKGDPGCFPQMGFIASPVGEWPNQRYFVTQVTKGSPAQAAGIKLEDEVIGVDSQPYSARINEDVYKMRKSVPVKVLRLGKEIRMNIAPRTLCVNDEVKL